MTKLRLKLKPFNAEISRNSWMLYWSGENIAM